MKKTVSVLLIACLGGFVSLGVYRLFEKNNQVIIQERTDSNQLQPFGASFVNLRSTPETQIDFTSAAEKTVNAVVHVKTVQEGQTYRYQDPFYDFFWGQGSREYEYKTPDRQGFGSGIIISDKGYIVTNNHVIQNADKIEVTLNDKRTYTAKLIGTDKSTDISLMKIDANDLHPIMFGNSDDVKIGEWVLAVGNPYNLTSTVTAGIVSAKGRSIGILSDKYKIESFIQTDAAVNPGNSGGALVNTSGELIGITSAIASPTGVYSGYSFAIPVDIVKKVVNDLMEYGEVKRSFIGVSIRNVDAQLASEKNIDVVKGVYVAGLSEGGAAKDAGIKEGDIITSINSIEVNTVPELQEQVGRYRPGDKISITIKRNNKEMSKTLLLRDNLGKAKTIGL